MSALKRRDGRPMPEWFARPLVRRVPSSEFTRMRLAASRGQCP